MTHLNDILPRLEQLLGSSESEPVALAGGITNRNYRVRLGGRDYLLRIHGASTALLGIDRDAERLANEAAARAHIAPAVAAALEDCLVTEFLDGGPCAEDDLAASVEDVARALRTFHESGVRLPRRFWVPDLLADYAALLREHGVPAPAELQEAARAAALIARALPLERACPCHNDLLSGNIIRCADQGPIMLVDWEYAGMGHPYFDLGNLSVNNGFDEATDERLLAAYDGRPATPGRRCALKLMRVMSDAREAAWGVLQSVISDLDFEFEAYAQRHFARLHAALDAPQFEEWLAGAQA